MPDSDIDDLMADVFGTTADEEHISDEPVEDEEPEIEPDAEPEEEAVEDEDYDDSDEDEDLDEDDDEDDGTDEDDDSDVGDDDGESDKGGDPDPGDGADDTLSDGQLALDLVTDQRIQAWKPADEAFDPSIVGSEAEFIEDHKEAMGDDYDEAYAEKLGKAAYRTATRAAKRKWEASAGSRTNARRDADASRIQQEINDIARAAPGELTRVQARMSEIYQQKINAAARRLGDQTLGLDAANSVPAKVYFALAGGRLRAPKPTGGGKEGVASQRAKAQKKGAVRGQQPTDQIGRVKTKKGKRNKRSAVDEAFSQKLDTHRAIGEFFFGD
jgi:hypothetical protein